jgi:hypothetical protein
VRYHSRRVRFYDRLNLATNACSIIFGSATVFALLNQRLGPEWVPYLAATVTVLSAINLIVGSTSMARLHEDLYRRFVALEKKLIAIPEEAFDNEAFVKLYGDKLDIEADEPPILRVLDCICYNEVVRATSNDSQQFIKIAWYQRLFAPLFDVNQHRLSKVV